ncbi:MAG: branched-chain amino acid ABC transporter substrate-binding protein [Desulfovibrionaceae bacterium]|nr:branched-chain amino acid ABC transporter substrate-binding protein [Desulfovibrionaceae bacterium]MBF0512794.1 branched-chain amino acid ABC transporter substrate-binding protein [Desulfovibrionaceae bacterium]
MKKGGCLLLVAGVSALAAALFIPFARKAAVSPFVCADPLGCLDLAPEEPLKLGVIESLTGKVATLGQEQVRGLELALARRGGKLSGRTVALQIEDSGCTPEGGANAALRITADPKIAAVFGTTCSCDAATAAKVVSQAGLSMISGNNSAPYLTALCGLKAPSWQDGYLRTAPNEEFSGPTAARFAHEKLGLRLAATVDDGDIYTTGLTGGFKKEFERLGGKVVLSATIDKGDVDMAPVLTAVTNSGADLVFFPLFQPEGNNLLLAARKSPDLQNLVLMSDGSLIDATFIAAVGQAAVGMYFVGPTPPPDSPELARLRDEYQTRYREAPPTEYYANAFDAAAILCDAIEKTAVTDPSGGLHLPRQALRDALYATAGHRGVTGRLTCDRFGDCARPSFNVLTLRDPACGIEGLKANPVFTFAADQ